jgi:SnoaL-like domain
VHRRLLWGDTAGVSEENVQVVRNLLEPFNGVDVTAVDWDSEAVRDALMASISPAVELRTLESGMGSGVRARYSGIEGVFEYLKEWLEAFSEYQAESLSYIDAGDYVLVPTRQWGIGKGSGVQADLELTALYEVRDGLIVLWAQYDTMEEAREAAGL